MNDEHERVEAIIREYGGKRDSLISTLQDIQSEYHYLPETTLRLVARQLALLLAF